MGSTRLPGKVLKPLNGHVVLEEVLRRVQAVVGVDEVVCATSDLAEDDCVVPVARKCGAHVSRGSALDVLSRYRKAAEDVGANIIMRVTADCPLIDPALCAEVLRCRAEANSDYAANNMPRSFPIGLDCEAFTFDALCRADKGGRTPEDREHVTPWLRRDPSVTRSRVAGPGGDVLKFRWTLDYPEDYDFMRAVFSVLPPPPAIAGWKDVAATLEQRPDIVALNAGRAAPTA